MTLTPRVTVVVAQPSQATIESVLAQTVDAWELLVRDAAPPTVPADPRIRPLGGDGRQALAEARGEYVMFLHDDEQLEPDAVRVLAGAAGQGADIVYAEEIEGPDGRDVATGDRVPKPDWSPERLRHYDYLGSAVALRTDLVRAVGGLRPEAGTAAGYDLILRATEQATGIVHVPTVVLRRGSAPAPTPEQCRSVVQDHLDRSGIAATARTGPDGYLRLDRRLDPDRLVSIVIPTIGQVGEVDGAPRTYVVEAVRSALARTRHPSLEIVVVYDPPTPPETLVELREVAGDRLVLLEYDKPFNFSEKCNLGVLASHGEVVVLLNDDTEVVSDRWLETLVAPLDEPDVGLTGAKLLYEDGTIQHAGHLYASGARPAHPLHGYRYWPDVTGPFGDLVIDRECSGVTAACVALRRAVYEEIGGLSELVPVNFNDVDLSLKVRHSGRRVLWMADTVLRHFESKSRVQSKARDFEIEFLDRRWAESFRRDAYAPWLSYEETIKPHEYRRWER
jgi:GT2 family glycosyltransferase